MGEKDDIELFRDGLLFKARPDVRRVIYIATPHQGSHLDQGPLEQAATRFVRIADPLRAAHDRLVSRNDTGFFRDPFRKVIPTSIEELDPESPILRGIFALHTHDTVKIHSIIAVRPALRQTERTDGLVRYASATSSAPPLRWSSQQGTCARIILRLSAKCGASWQSTKHRNQLTRCKDKHSKAVKAARTKLQGRAKLGWSDREYVAVIKGGPRRIGHKPTVRVYRKLTVRRYRASK